MKSRRALRSTGVVTVIVARVRDRVSVGVNGHGSRPNVIWLSDVIGDGVGWTNGGRWATGDVAMNMRIRHRPTTQASRWNVCRSISRDGRRRCPRICGRIVNSGVYAAGRKCSRIRRRIVDGGVYAAGRRSVTGCVAQARHLRWQNLNRVRERARRRPRICDIRLANGP
jgi:hypothetical protein